MSLKKPSPIIKPTLNTKFHIDYDWWERDDEDLRTYLLSHLPAEQREHFLDQSEARVVDYVHPKTAEVFQLDELGLAIQEAAKAPDFINPQTSLVDSVFRVFLANGNVPQTPKELSERTNRQAAVILKTFGGVRVYKGVRPYIPVENEEA